MVPYSSTFSQQFRARDTPDPRGLWQDWPHGVVAIWGCSRPCPRNRPESGDTSRNFHSIRHCRSRLFLGVNKGLDRPKSTFVLAAVALGFALRPPEYLQYIVVFSGTGLAATFLWPTLLGIYWPRMNKAGCLAGMLTGFLSFVAQYAAFGTLSFGGFDPFIWAVLMSLVVSVGGAWMTAPPPEGVRRSYFGYGAYVRSSAYRRRLKLQLSWHGARASARYRERAEKLRRLFIQRTRARWTDWRAKRREALKNQQWQMRRDRHLDGLRQCIRCGEEWLAVKEFFALTKRKRRDVVTYTMSLTCRACQAERRR